ncbi:MAG TPA: hypothetical protein VE913_18040 [Longimicrobium sp.]|nr:hypothetical protein [Longimicrobium sp.]
MLMWLLFFFLAFGSKVVLAFAMIYLMLDSDRACPSCDSETMGIRLEGWKRWLGILSRGYVEQRWCPRCQWDGLTRTGRGSHAGARPQSGSHSLR